MVNNLMISFEKFFVLDEAVFRKSKHNTHFKDFPMFSVFYEKSLANDLGISEEELVDNLNQKLSYISTALQRARTEIGKMGFPSMHANVVFSNLSNRINPNTGGKTGGLAYPKRRYMKIDYNEFMRYESFARDVIIHEWAHLWMFSKSTEFREAINDLYHKIFEKVPVEKKYEEYYARKRVSIFNDVNYAINELVEKPSIRELMKNEYTGSDSYIIDILRKRIKYCVDHGLVRLGIDLGKVNNKDYEFLDELTDTFYDSLIASIEEMPQHIDEVLNAENIEDNMFNTFASSEMEHSLKYVIMDKIKEMFFKYSSNLSIYLNELVSFAKGSEGGFFRTYLRKLINWYDAYGMSNPDEFWATAIEGFFNLPYEHRRNIVKIMLQHN